MLVSRDNCLGCRSDKLSELSGGSFNDEPLRSFIDEDPWGENPLDALKAEVWSLVQCDDCGLKFHRFILSPEWNEIRFTRWMNDEAIRQFEEAHGTNQDSGAANAQHALRLKQLGVRRVLDFGCGFGQFLQMCQLFGIEAVGVDRSNARRSGAALEVVADLDDTTGQFDAITMFEVLEHLDDPLATLQQLKKRLSPGGIMVIEVPDTSGVTAIDSRDAYHKVHPLDHINAFTPATLERFMRFAGFAPIRKNAAFVTTSPVRLAKDAVRSILPKPTTQRYFREVG